MKALPEPTPILLARFDKKVDRHGEHDCWLWTGAVQSRGYGSFGFGPRGATQSFLAHRLAYHWFVGPIAEGMTIDHVCHNLDRTCVGGVDCIHRLCVNPTHLEPVPSSVNSARTTHHNAARLRELHPNIAPAVAFPVRAAS